MVFRNNFSAWHWRIFVVAFLLITIFIVFVGNNDAALIEQLRFSLAFVGGPFAGQVARGEFFYSDAVPSSTSWFYPMRVQTLWLIEAVIALMLIILPQVLNTQQRLPGKIIAWFFFVAGLLHYFFISLRSIVLYCN